MKVDLTKEEIEISITLFDQVVVKLDQADTLLKLRDKYKQVLKQGEK